MPRVVQGRVELSSIPGQVPRLDQLGSGCAFAARCLHATDRCEQELPTERSVGEDHLVVCWHDEANTRALARSDCHTSAVLNTRQPSP